MVTDEGPLAVLVSVIDPEVGRVEVEVVIVDVCVAVLLVTEVVFLA